MSAMLTDEERYNLKTSEEKKYFSGLFDGNGKEITMAQQSPFPMWSSQDDYERSKSQAESESETQPAVLCKHS